MTSRYQKIFKDGENLTSYVSSRDGLTTGNNELFIRFFWEVPIRDIGLSYSNAETFWDSHCKYAPLIKGGHYRKWYGNNDFIVDYYNDGEELINLVKEIIAL